MVKGEPTFFGTYEELQDFAGNNESASAFVETENEQERQDTFRTRKEEAKEEDGVIMTVEERYYGVSSFVDWATWFINAGGIPFIVFQCLFLVLDRGLFVLSDWWLSLWSDSAYEELELGPVIFPPQTDGRDAQKKYVGVYSIIVLFSVLATSLRSYWMCEYTV
jgi:hypothetical protein